MNISVHRAAEVLGIGEQRLRIYIQRKRFDFAFAEKFGEKGVNHNYFINAKGLADYVGKSIEEVTGNGC
jgi:hypothetical protein